MSETERNVYVDLLQGKGLRIYKDTTFSYVPNPRSIPERHEHDISPPVRYNQPIEENRATKKRRREKRQRDFMRTLMNLK